MRLRGQKAAATRQHILEAARGLFGERSAEFTLEKVAEVAGTSVQTVLRAYGNKEALILEAIGSFRADEAAPVEPLRSVAESVRRIFDDYEEIGDRAIRMLAEEHRIPGFAEVAQSGRKRHRVWVEAAFSKQLAKHSTHERAELVLGLLAATDVYVWKLYRRDFGLSRKTAESAVERLISAALSSKKRS